jgi:hypothetical protein
MGDYDLKCSPKSYYTRSVVLMKKIIILCFALLFLFSTTAAMATKEEVRVPTKVKVISQSCMAERLCITVIDLECNEVVVIFYSVLASGLFKGSLKLNNLIRTGMFVEPDEQAYVIGQDAPFVEGNEQGKEPKFPR